MQAPAAARGIHRIVRVNYPIRAASFAFTFVVLTVHGWGDGRGPLFWALLALTFLVYPHLVYLYTARAREPKKAEITCMYVDAALLGAWVGALQFPLWIMYSLLFSTTLNAIALGGMPGAFWSVASFGFGAAMAVAGTGGGYGAETSDTVTTLAFLGSLVYSSAVGWVMHEQNRGLVAARGAMHESEDRYRLLAENAAELIALVDEDARWLYTSPSYERLLERADLEHGADALRRVHPDDADRVRIAVLRSAASGKPQQLEMRLVDKSGRIRSLRTRVKAIEGTPRRLVFISDDLTDVTESEERLLLAAHALEGMTEAIVITAADGTVVTVNRAFTEITGYSKDEVLGGPEREIRNALQPPEYYDEIHRILQREGYWSGTTWSRRKNGSVYREWRSVRAVRDAAGKATHHVMVFYEVGPSSRPRVEEVKA
jgi:PAS domain S-box-containing protein